MYYHVWFKTKHRKWLLLGDIKEAVKRTMGEVAARHKIRLLQSETMVDHVHLLVEVEDRAELSKAMNLLKGVSARVIMQEFPELPLDAQADHLWQKRYGFTHVDPSAIPSVRDYIRTQKGRLEKYER